MGNCCETMCDDHHSHHHEHHSNHHDKHCKYIRPEYIQPVHPPNHYGYYPPAQSASYSYPSSYQSYEPPKYQHAVKNYNKTDLQYSDYSSFANIE